MQRKRNRPSRRSTEKPARWQLPSERAFVLHLDVSARLPRRVIGRIEHVTSGQRAYVTSLREPTAFMATVLGDDVAAGGRTPGGLLDDEPRDRMGKR